MSVTLRELNTSTDFPRMAELISFVTADPVTVQLLQEGERKRPEGAIRHRLVAVDEAGQIAGFGQATRPPWARPGLYWLRVIVDPALRKQGIGATLYRSLFEFARDQGAGVLASEVRDDCVGSLQFAEHRGFQIDRHLFGSTLNVAAFDESRFAGTIEAVQAGGIQFFTFADLGGTLDHQRALYELNTLTGRDVPGSEWDGVRPFEQFQKDVFDAFWFRPDGQIIAADGDRWVGLGALGEIAPGVMYNMMTGVLREYRGRKIALALKLLGIQFCRKHGASIARTNNDSLNQPMLAINRKLGYEPDPGWYRLLKELP
jgi:GNAT superfamily N-acetyltransferase